MLCLIQMSISVDPHIDACQKLIKCLQWITIILSVWNENGIPHGIVVIVEDVCTFNFWNESAITVHLKEFVVIWKCFLEWLLPCMHSFWILCSSSECVKNLSLWFMLF